MFSFHNLGAYYKRQETWTDRIVQTVSITRGDPMKPYTDRHPWAPITCLPWHDNGHAISARWSTFDKQDSSIYWSEYRWCWHRGTLSIDAWLEDPRKTYWDELEQMAWPCGVSATVNRSDHSIWLTFSGHSYSSMSPVPFLPAKTRTSNQQAILQVVVLRLTQVRR